MKPGARVLLFLATSMVCTACSVLPSRQASELSTDSASDPDGLGTAALHVPGTYRSPPPIFPSLNGHTTDVQLKGSLTSVVGSDVNAAPPGDLWPLMTNEFELEHHLNQRSVQAAVRKFTKNPEWIAAAQEKMSLYLPYFLKETRRRNLPAELALVPIIESTLNPDALSPRGALGLWQFMPATATRFGLSRDWWHDSRQDTVASTKAALDYLELLHAQFGDWLLTLAAYNAGEGTVARTLPQVRHRPNTSARFFDMRLPEETRNYVPQVLALAAIIKDPDKYDVQLPEVSSDISFKSLKTRGPVDLESAASVLNVSPAELVALNPSLKRQITPPSGTDNLLVPARIDAHAQARLNAMPANSATGAIVQYRVQQGDSLSSIANRFGSSIVAVKQLNGLATNTIRANSTLQIPRLGAAGLASIEADVVLAGSSPTQTASYRVRSGDTLGAIARRFNSDVSTLKLINGLRSNFIKTSMTLKVPAGNSAIAAVNQMKTPRAGRLVDTPTTAYRVRSGDSLSTIASAHETTVANLKHLNGLRGDQLRVNRILRVPVGPRASGNMMAANSALVQPESHTVRSGDTLWRIARKYDVSHQALIKANGFREGQVLSVGRVLRIPQPATTAIAGG